MNLDVEKAERALEYIKGYAKGYITDKECNEMMDIIQFEEYNPKFSKTEKPDKNKSLVK